MTLPATYLISLSSARDRRDMSIPQLNELGLSFSIFDAVDGRDLKDKDYEYYNNRRRLRYFGRRMRNTEIGCFLSHYSIYKEISDKSISCAFILEDDVVLCDDITKIIEEILDSNFEYDFIRFLKDEKVSKLKPRNILSLSSGHSVDRLPTSPGGAHAYLVSISGAKKVLDYVEKNGFCYPIDILIGRFWETGVDGYAVNFTAYQNPDIETSTEPERFDKRIQLSGLNAAIFPFFRAWFKIDELVRKRLVYRLLWLRDNKSRKRLSSSSKAS